MGVNCLQNLRSLTVVEYVYNPSNHIVYFLLLLFPGTRVGLVDTNKSIQAWGIVCKRNELHGRKLEEGHVVVAVTEVLETCNLKPACPGPFDDPSSIHEGEFHSWPLASLALPLKLN